MLNITTTTTITPSPGLSTTIFTLGLETKSPSTLVTRSGLGQVSAAIQAVANAEAGTFKNESTTSATTSVKPTIPTTFIVSTVISSSSSSITSQPKISQHSSAVAVSSVSSEPSGISKSDSASNPGVLVSATLSKSSGTPTLSTVSEPGSTLRIDSSSDSSAIGVSSSSSTTLSSYATPDPSTGQGFNAISESFRSSGSGITPTPILNPAKDAIPTNENSIGNSTNKANSNARSVPTAGIVVGSLMGFFAFAMILFVVFRYCSPFRKKESSKEQKQEAGRLPVKPIEISTSKLSSDSSSGSLSSTDQELNTRISAVQGIGLGIGGHLSLLRQHAPFQFDLHDAPGLPQPPSTMSVYHKSQYWPYKAS